MSRALLLTVLLTIPAVADARKDHMDLRKKLEDVYFDQLKPDERDELFDKLGGYDHKDAIPTIVDVASRFGTYIGGLEAQLGALQVKLEPLTKKPALTDLEIGLRNSYIRKVEKLEKQTRRARQSEDVLVNVLGKLKEPKAIDAALKSMPKHPTARVRQLCARACGVWHTTLKDVKTSKRMLSTLKTMARDQKPVVRIGVARAIASYKRIEAFNLLKSMLNDKDWRVRVQVVKGLHEAGTDEAVDALIKRMKREDGRLKDDINKVLKDLTGQKHNYPEAWAGWWQSVGKTVPKRKPDPEAPAGSDPKAKDTAAFYGIPTRSDHICFIIDISGSMNKEVEPIKYRGPTTGTGKKDDRPVEGKTRIEVAKNELKRAIGNLSPKKEFSVIFFNHATQKWRPTMIKATRPVQKELRKDLEAIRARGATYTLGALRQAFVMAGVIKTAKSAKTGKDQLYLDTIFLLSDGGPTDNKIEEVKPMNPDLILEQVKQWNRDAGVVIHCIAVDCDENGTYFLRNLAAQNGGIFVERKR